MVFVPAVSTFAISKLLGGSKDLLLGDLIEIQFLGSAYNPHLGSAISLVMMVIVVICMVVMNRFGEGEETGGDAMTKRTPHRKPPVHGAGLPLSVRPHFRADRILLQQQQEPCRLDRLLPGLVSGAVPRRARSLSALSTTLSVSVLAALIATVAGTFAAIGFYNMRKRWSRPLLTINNIPVINADIATGVSLCLLFVAAGGILHFDLGYVTLLIAHITFNIPYVIMSIMPKLLPDGQATSSTPPKTWAAPGCRPFIRWSSRRSCPASSTALLIAFTMSIDDFVISYFTAGSKVQTLSMTIYAMTRKRISPEINAVSTLLFVTVLLLLAIVNIREMQQENARKKALKRAQQ